MHPRICIFVILLSGWCRTRMRPARLVSYAFLYTTSVEFFSSLSTRKLRMETVQCFRVSLVPRLFLDKLGGRHGVARFSVKDLLCHSVENFCSGNVQSFKRSRYRRTSLMSMTKFR